MDMADMIEARVGIVNDDRVDQVLELLLKQNELLERHLKAMEAIVGFAAKALETPVKERMLPFTEAHP
jgi:hypothetical protein